MAADPDAAESILNQEDGYAQQEACADAHVCMEAPVVEYGRADDALCHIVCHAHFAVGYEQT